MLIPHTRTEATRDDWQTPLWLQSLICNFARDRSLVTIDPCASDRISDWFCDWNRTRKVPYARLHDVPNCNDNDAPTLVYCNPPYGSALAHWSIAIDRWMRTYPIVVALVPARPGSVWWSRLAKPNRPVIVPYDRLTFVGADNGAAFPSALIVGGVTSGLVEAFIGQWIGDAWISVSIPWWWRPRCESCGHSETMHDASLCACLGRNGSCACKAFEAPARVQGVQTEAPLMWCDPMLPKPKQRKAKVSNERTNKEGGEHLIDVANQQAVERMGDRR